MKSFLKILLYQLTSKKPWSRGYTEYKWKLIAKNIQRNPLNAKLELPPHFGIGIDERIIEYTWAFKHLENKNSTLLDAGSTFNFNEIISSEKIQAKHVTIFNYNKEKNHFANKNVFYEYGDLRKMPFKNESFDEVVCISTIEHIDMDNSIYGYDIKNNSLEKEKSYEFLFAIDELIRVMRQGGELLLTFPFGMYKNYGFYQQFDAEMVSKIEQKFNALGKWSGNFYKYNQEGWQMTTKEECATIFGFNPHSGEGKLDDNAAHSRSVCCLKFTKN